MLLEARMEDTVVYIDAETAGGINKGDLAVSFEPDEILDNVVAVAGIFARKLSEAAAQASVALPAPSNLTLRFGIRVDNNSVVSVARSPEGAQFQVTVAWTPGH